MNNRPVNCEYRTSAAQPLYGKKFPIWEERVSLAVLLECVLDLRFQGRAVEAKSADCAQYHGGVRPGDAAGAANALDGGVDFADIRTLDDDGDIELPRCFVHRLDAPDSSYLLAHLARGSGRVDRDPSDSAALISVVHVHGEPAYPAARLHVVYPAPDGGFREAELRGELRVGRTRILPQEIQEELVNPF